MSTTYSNLSSSADDLDPEMLVGGEVPQRVGLGRRGDRDAAPVTRNGDQPTGAATAHGDCPQSAVWGWPALSSMPPPDGQCRFGASGCLAWCAVLNAPASPSHRYPARPWPTPLPRAAPGADPGRVLGLRRHRRRLPRRHLAIRSRSRTLPPAPPGEAEAKSGSRGSRHSGTEAPPAEAPPKKRSRGAWVVLVVVVALFVLAVITGLLSPTVVLDLAALWPIGLGLVALAVLVGLLGRRRGAGARAAGGAGSCCLGADLGGAPPHRLVGASFVGRGCRRRGPRRRPHPNKRGQRGARCRLVWDPIRSTRWSRCGAVVPTTAPSVLEQVVGECSTVSVLEYPSAGWFRFAGWNVELSPDPLWTVSITSPDFRRRPTPTRGSRCDLRGRWHGAAPRCDRTA